VAAEALGDASVVKELVEALEDERGVVVHRAANALKKVQAERPELVVPFAKKVLRAAMECEVLFARWDLTLVVGEMPLKGAERALAIELMYEGLRSESGLLKTIAMQGLTDLSVDDPSLRRRVMRIVEEFAASGTAAMRARARMLLAAEKKTTRRRDGR